MNFLYNDKVERVRRPIRIHVPRPHYPLCFYHFLELLAHVTFCNKRLICTQGRTEVRLVMPLVT
jgi:hypothetical protein